MLKAENKSQTKLKYFTLKLRVNFHCNHKRFIAKLLEGLIFIK